MEQLSLGVDPNAFVLVPDDVWGAVAGDLLEFDDWVEDRLMTAIAVDTETAGFGWDDEVRLVQIGDADQGWAIDVTQPVGRVLARDIFESHSGPFLFYNAPFDIRALGRIGIDTDMLWERAVEVHHLCHVWRPDRVSFKLKQIGDAELGAGASDAQKQLTKAMTKNHWTWATVPLHVLAPYAIQDVKITHALYQLHLERLSEQDWDVIGKEKDVVQRISFEVEKHGMRLDREYALELQATWTTELAEEREWFKTQKIDADLDGDHTEVQNPNANAQLCAALWSQGWRPTEFTEKTGKPKLDKKILESLSGKYELVDRLLEYKRKTKWLAAYVDNCLAQVDDNGYVHASYNTLGAKTGRMSCSNPPLQQLPKGGGGEVRRLFVSSPGNVIASVDYSAIEFRLAGALSGEQRIIDAFLAGDDPYQQVADDLNITRTEAKLLQLQTLFGARPKRISLSLGFPYARAKRVYDGFWELYPTLDEWVKQQTAMAEAGVPSRSMWGRRLRPHASYAAANAIIQGTAAEVLKEGLLRLEKTDQLKWVCAIVHDEVVLDVPEAFAEAIAKNVAHVLEDRRFAVPLVAEASVYGASWGSGYE